MDRRLNVLMDGRHLGELRQERTDIELIYDPAWIGSGGYAVSPHIPLSGEPGSDTVQRFLANLLPEGPFLEVLSRSTGCSKYNTFGLVAAIGAETAGALSFHASDGAAHPPTTFREIPQPELAERIASRGERSIIMWDEKPRLSVAGVQDKLPVLIQPDGRMGFGEGGLCSTHILKFGKTRGAELHLVVNEYLCMRLAALIGLTVAEVEFQRLGEPVLSVRRFDRRWEGERVSRLHLIDGCQILDLSPAYKYERPLGKARDVANIRDGASLPLLFEACRKFCTVPAAAIKNLLDWTLFQLVIGNSDAHGKNISFFVGRKGLQVAPAYDLVCLDLYEEYDRDLAMAVGDCFDPGEIAPYQLADMCEDCRIPRRPAARSLDALCEKTLHAAEVLPLEFSILTAEERAFAERVLARVKGNARRLRGFAQELPKVRL